LVRHLTSIQENNDEEKIIMFDFAGIVMMEDFSRFSNLWQKLGAKNNPQPLFEQLVASYAESQRAYHTLTHIHDCLAQFDQAITLAQHPAEVEAALWLHDAIYNPGASNNEELSADWATTILTQGHVPAATIDRVCRLILATRHKSLPENGDAALLVDIDLSILGRDAATFERYEQQIRQEYRFVPEQDYREGRCAILASFLSRASVYQTPFFREHYESRARENLSRSVAKLRGVG
jgi:predicted metal-dependent HD superfamily phosphohydrolase